MEKIQVILVDDHSLFRNGLKILLTQSDRFDVVAEASNGEEFMKYFEIFPHAVVLMDIEMRVMNGIEATSLAINKNPHTKIIALTMFSDKQYYYKMIEAGARGFLLKDSPITEVVEAIELVTNGESYFSKELLLDLVKDFNQLQQRNGNLDLLTERELEVLQLICQGFSNQEIGEKLFISKRTVDKHRSNILDKTGTRNTAGLVIFAIKNELVKL